MPPLHPCGLAVDWVRSAQYGFWRFFAGTDQATYARFYYVPAGTPHYDKPHFFGSDYWRRGDPGWPFALGHQSLDGFEYSDGAKVPLRPCRPAPNIGTETPAQGFSLPATPDPHVDELGIAAECYVPLPVPPAPLLVTSPFPAISLDWVDSCCFWVLACEMLRRAYENELASIGSAFRRWLGPGTYAFARAQERIDPLFIYQNRTGNVIGLCGTTTFTELLAEFMWGAVPPQRFGGVSGHFVFNQYAELVMSVLRALNVDFSLPTLIFGHSAGAATAVVLSARLRQANPARPLGVVTIACPKPGGETLINEYFPIRQRNLIYEGDPIPGLPLNLLPPIPGFGFIVGKVIGVGIGLFRGDDNIYLPLTRYSLIKDDGTLENINELPWAHLLRVIQFLDNDMANPRNAQPGRPPGAVARLTLDHSVENYKRRLQLICCPEPPQDFREAFRYLEITRPAPLRLVRDEQWDGLNATIFIDAQVKSISGGVVVAPFRTSPVSLSGAVLGGDGGPGRLSGGVETSGADVPPTVDGGIETGGADVPPLGDGGGAEVGGGDVLPEADGGVEIGG